MPSAASRLQMRLAAAESLPSVNPCAKTPHPRTSPSGSSTTPARRGPVVLENVTRSAISAIVAEPLGTNDGIGLQTEGSFASRGGPITDHSNDVRISGRVITTSRLRLRPWRVEDADEALRIFGSDEVARWLAPAMTRVVDLAEMRALLQGWTLVDAADARPIGRW